MAASRAGKRVVLPWWPSIDLSRLHTRVLLKLLDYARRRHYDVLPMRDGTDSPVHYIRVELAKREHVPNKAEARLARQKAAKSRERRRRVGGYRSHVREAERGAAADPGHGPRLL
jgi:hypothetical protein